VIVDHPRFLAGRYRIDEPLGRGGMGTVHAGHDLRLGRDVAVKLLRDDRASDPSLRRRFEREARAAARVSHPNVVAIYDTGEDEAHDTFIVMERLTGRTLGHELATGPFDEARLREVADAVLGALAAAHAEGLVHRDVKPGNILLAEDGTLKVGDFGIATTLDAGDSTTRVPFGTPAYTAPERLCGFSATPRSDLYSLAVVLYEAATGVRPFAGDGAVAVAEAVVAGEHVALRDLRPDLSPPLVDAVERALSTDPDDRFPDAASMRAALDPPGPASGTVTLPLTTSAAPTAVLPPPRTPVPTSTPTPAHPAGTTAALAGAPAPDRAARAPRRPGVVRVVAGVLVAVVLVVAIALLVTRGDGSSGVPASTAPATTVAPAPAGGAPLPAPLARALDRLQQATHP
jgi:serine/threonine protein kinase